MNHTGTSFPLIGLPGRGSVGINGARLGTTKTPFGLDGMCMAKLGPTFQVLEANTDFVTLFDIGSGGDSGDLSFYDLVHPGIQGRVRRQFERLTEGQSRIAVQMVGIRQPSESTFSAEVTAVATHGHDGRVSTVGVVVTPEKPDEPEATCEDSPAVADRVKVLTALDARVLEGVAAGSSTIEMASKLCLSRQGVEYHISSMLRKLRAPNRAALVSRAYAMGVLSIGYWPPKVLPDCIKP
ncbi:LuxR C-terminal-related transcriptional regulator [Streptomyces sp. NPDC003077]|uniref:helix-turn-helix transcriptional regulator n=1 Tax=Streptomyces sp. NPDC003077 TaxID=3154443 RepID=UPI0033B4AA7D